MLVADAAPVLPLPIKINIRTPIFYMAIIVIVITTITFSRTRMAGLDREIPRQVDLVATEGLPFHLVLETVDFEGAGVPDAVPVLIEDLELNNCQSI